MSERNRSPFAELNGLKEAARKLLDVMSTDDKGDISEDVDRLRAATQSASTWLLGELFEANKCLPYNADVKDEL